MESMTQTTDTVDPEAELIHLLLSNAHEPPAGCHGNPPWATSVREQPADDFLESLLGGSEGVSSAGASPLWSPSASDSGVSDSHPWDPLDSPCPGPPSPQDFSTIYARTLPLLAPTLAALPPGLGVAPGLGGPPDVSIDFSFMEPDDLREKFGVAYYLSAPPSSLQPHIHTPTVKDLLMTSIAQKSQPKSQHSLHELVLDEDEKKLLAKEGVHLPNKLPLSKDEERLLKKIRRKIRNKRSAQESRQKKREYVDSLEGRMSACSAYNLDLQRKVIQLEHSNNSLLEELSRLQDLLVTRPTREPPGGTVLLVLLLSFSLLLSVSLQPSGFSQQDYTQNKGPFRILQWVEDPMEVWPPTGGAASSSLMERLWRPNLPSGLHQDHGPNTAP